MALTVMKVEKGPGLGVIAWVQVLVLVRSRVVRWSALEGKGPLLVRCDKCCARRGNQWSSDEAMHSARSASKDGGFEAGAWRRRGGCDTSR